MTGRKIRRLFVWLILVVALFLAGPLLTLAFGRASLHGDWRNATHRSAGLAPDPVSHREAIVQVYASRTFGWRGAFADHTWLAAKPADADAIGHIEGKTWNHLVLAGDVLLVRNGEEMAAFRLSREGQ